MTVAKVMFKEPQSQQEALSHALALAITAPTNKHAAEAEALAEHLASGLTAGQVESAKTLALALIGQEEVSV